jgi:hypothetical protein
MSLRPTAETIESLRITLKKLEENFVSVEDEPAMGELKHILLLRIAELEALESAGTIEREPVSEEIIAQTSPIELPAEQECPILRDSKD